MGQMKNLITALFLLIAVASQAKTIADIDKELTIQAVQEKWTFQYDASQVGQFKTGLVSNGLKKGKQPKGVSFDNLKGLGDVEIPEKYDWRDKGIGAIRNQGDCGSCWAFSITSVLNDVYMIYAPSMYKGQLSEQYLTSCARDMFGCGGGMPTAWKWMIAPQGAPTLAEYPYTSGNTGNTGSCQMSNKKVVGSVTEWHYVGSNDRSPTIDEIKKAVFAYGPVSVTVAADNAFLAYKSGVFNACNSTSTNHMITIVGWDNATKSWIVRNSWGLSWGENGFGKVAWTGRNGQLCNALGEETTYAKIVMDPPKPPPGPATFQMDFSTVHFDEIKIEPEAKYSAEDLKKIITNEMQKFEEIEDEI